MSNTLVLPFCISKQSTLYSTHSKVSTAAIARYYQDNGTVRNYLSVFPPVLLILPSGSLPSRDEVIWAILIAHYLPEIYPDVPLDSTDSAWHVTDDFEEDHKYACTRAAELWSWIFARDPDGERGWNRLTREIEIDAWRAIEYYQDPESSPKVPKKLYIEFMCLGHDHIHD